jgi:hypothetical protein
VHRIEAARREPPVSQPATPSDAVIAAPTLERDRVPLVAGLLVAAAGFPLGLLAGWAIWG